MNKLLNQILLTRVSHGLLTLVLLIFSGDSLSESLADARMQVGINLFPTFLAARITPPEDHEHVAVLFADRRPAVELVAERLRERLSKKNVNDRVSLIGLKDLIENASTNFTAVFITQTLTTEELDQALAFASKHKILTFSPLPGDVERGVLGGIAVSDRVLPSINMQTLRNHSIELKPFFKKVSDRYEPRSSR